MTDKCTTLCIYQLKMKYKIDSNLEKEVQEFMKNVLKKLTVDNQKIDESWNSALTLMADNYNTFVKCSKELNTSGLTVKDRFNNTLAHPLIKIKNDAQIQLVKLLIEFGLTLKSGSKIQVIENDDESPLMNFVNNKNKIEKR